MHFEKEIRKILSSNNFLVYILTTEEERLEYILKNISNKLFSEKIHVWNFIDGYTENPNQLQSSKQNPLEALEIITKYDRTNTRVFF